jgi:uncharacterized membrane protein
MKIYDIIATVILFISLVLYSIGLFSSDWTTGHFTRKSYNYDLNVKNNYSGGLFVHCINSECTKESLATVISLEVCGLILLLQAVALWSFHLAIWDRIDEVGLTRNAVAGEVAFTIIPFAFIVAGWSYYQYLIVSELRNEKHGYSFYLVLAAFVLILVSFIPKIISFVQNKSQNNEIQLEDGKDLP